MLPLKRGQSSQLLTFSSIGVQKWPAIVQSIYRRARAVHCLQADPMSSQTQRKQDAPLDTGDFGLTLRTDSVLLLPRVGLLASIWMVGGERLAKGSPD